MRSVALGVEPGLPGLDEVTPDGSPVADVGKLESAVRWYTIGAEYRDESAPDAVSGTDSPE